jgi:hypothetical protein
MHDCCRVLLGVYPSGGSKVARARGKKVRFGVHEAVLSLILDLELALFSDVDNVEHSQYFNGKFR